MSKLFMVMDSVTSECYYFEGTEDECKSFIANYVANAKIKEQQSPLYIAKGVNEFKIISKDEWMAHRFNVIAVSTYDGSNKRSSLRGSGLTEAEASKLLNDLKADHERLSHNKTAALIGEFNPYESFEIKEDKLSYCELY